MRRALTALLSALALAAWGAPPAPPEAPVVKEVTLAGASAFPAEELLDALGIGRRVAWRPFYRPEPLTREAFEGKIAELERLYFRKGYFEAAVTGEILADGTGLLRVAEGQATTVGSLEVEPSAPPPEEIPLAERVTGLPLAVGAPFDAGAYEASQSVVAGWWKECGYPFVTVTPSAEVDLAAGSAVVRYRVEPGERLSFGATEIRGLRSAEEGVLRRALAWREGRLFQQSLVDKTVENLVLLGLFDAVSVHPEPGGGGLVPMVVEVVEGRARMVRAGAGYSSEDGARLLVGWETLHLWGRTLTLGTLGTFSGRERKIGGYFRRPYPWDSRSRFSVDAEGGEREETSFDYNFLDVRAGFDQGFGRGFQAGLFARMERVLQFSPDVDLDQALERGVTEVDTLASVILGVTYDKTDDRVSPSRGYRAMVSAEPTWVLDTGATFARFQMEGRYYLPAGEGRVIAFRLKAGLLEGEDPGLVPLTRRFYAGGPFSVRGYRYQGLGPLSGTGALLGGNALVEASAELRAELPRGLLGVLFADAGNAFTDWSAAGRGGLYTSAGAGLRYQTPAGPLGLDVAFKLKDDPLDRSPMAVHFYIGFAF